MGNRANVVIENYSNERIYLYSHWDGESVIEAAVVGITSGRFGDPSYLARIVFQKLVGDDTGETGYGISPSLEDNEHEILVLGTEAIWFENNKGDKLTAPRVPLGFLETLAQFDSWEELANGGELYAPLIARLGS